MTPPTPGQAHRQFVREAIELVAASPIEVPGHDLRQGAAVWVDLDAETGEGGRYELAVTIFPVRTDPVGLDDLWIRVRAGDSRHSEQLDHHGQCRISGLPPGRWGVSLLETSRSSPSARSIAVPEPSAGPVPGFAALIHAVTDDNPITCCAALDALRARTGGAWSDADLEPITRQLQHNPEAIVRKAAAELLGEVAGPAGVPPLLHALDDPAWSVQHAAAVSLGLIGDPQTEGPLKDVATDPDRDPAVTEAAAEALDRLREAHGLKIEGNPRTDRRAAAVVDDAADMLISWQADRAPRPTAALWDWRAAAGLHPGAFDQIGRLVPRSTHRTPDGQPPHGLDQELGGQTIAALAARSGTPVPVRGSPEHPAGAPVPVLLARDEQGRTMTVSRSGDSFVVDVVGLGITDRRTVVRLPIRVAGGSAHLLAPLRWNHQTRRCEGRLALLDTDLVVDDGHPQALTLDSVDPAVAQDVNVSVQRARGETMQAWAVLSTDPQVHQQIRAAIRAASRRPPDSDQSGDNR